MSKAFNTTIGVKRDNPSNTKPIPVAKKQKRFQSESVIFANKSICIATSLMDGSINKIESMITNNGGKVIDSCSQNCDYVIAGNNIPKYGDAIRQSQICKDAKELKVPVVREQFIYDCIEQNYFLDVFTDKESNNDKNQWYTILHNQSRNNVSNRTRSKYQKKNKIFANTKQIDNPETFAKHISCNKSKTRDIGMVFYFRALDRFPGGNADMMVIKFVLLLNGKNNINLYKISRNNWDGCNEISMNLYEIKDIVPKERVKCIDGICTAIIDLYNDAKKVDIKGNAQDHSYEIVDKRSDSDEYDTEWSHIEVRVFIPPHSNGGNGGGDGGKMYKSEECRFMGELMKDDAIYSLIGIIDDYIGRDIANLDIEKDWTQIMKFMTVAIYRVKWDELPIPKKPLSKSGDLLIQNVSKFCGIERVENESENETVSASDDKKFASEGVDIDDISDESENYYEMPFYLFKSFDYK